MQWTNCKVWINNKRKQCFSKLMDSTLVISLMTKPNKILVQEKRQGAKANAARQLTMSKLALQIKSSRDKKLTASSTYQFSSVTQSCPTLCDPMNHSTPGLPVHHQLPEFIQTHVHWVGDAIQPSHPQVAHGNLLLKHTFTLGPRNILLTHSS